MTTATMVLIVVPALPWWAVPEYWVAGAPRKVGNAMQHVNYSGEECRTVGAPVGHRPLEEACERIKFEAGKAKSEHERAARERQKQVAQIAGLDLRYAIAYPAMTAFARYRKVADELGLSPYEVADALDEASAELLAAS